MPTTSARAALTSAFSMPQDGPLSMRKHPGGRPGAVTALMFPSIKVSTTSLAVGAARAVTGTGLV